VKGWFTRRGLPARSGSVKRRLRPLLWRQLRVGGRVVSHDVGMGPGWPTEHRDSVSSSTIYAWTATQQGKNTV
jgi:hypothetical protein